MRKITEGWQSVAKIGSMLTGESKPTSATWLNLCWHPFLLLPNTSTTNATKNPISSAECNHVAIFDLVGLHWPEV